MADFFKILVIFCVIVFLLRKKWNLGLVLVVASLVLAVSCLLHPFRIISVFFKSVTAPSSVSLVIILVLISFLEKVMRKNGSLQLVIDSLNNLLSNKKIVMTLMPAFLGLLPSPGGAMFSAPMVEETAKGSSITAEQKTFINYWFRHIWEYILPIYPAVIITASIAEISVRQFLMSQLHLTLLVIILGFIVLWSFKIPQEKNNNLTLRELFVNVKNLLFGVSPVVILLLLVLLFRVNLLVAVLVVVVTFTLISRMKKEEIWTGLKESVNVNTTLMVFSVFIFKDMLLTCKVAQGLSLFLTQLGIPAVVLFFVLPFIIGFLSGVSIGPVGVVFPILFSLTSPINIHLVSFAYASALAGVLLSPVHLCLVLTMDYFKADVQKTYKLLYLPTSAFILLAYVFTKF